MQTLDFSQLPAEWQAHITFLEDALVQSDHNFQVVLAGFVLVGVLAAIALWMLLVKKPEPAAQQIPQGELVRLMAYDSMFAGLEAAGLVNERWLEQIAHNSGGRAVYRQGVLLVSTATYAPDDLLHAPRLQRFVNDIRGGKGKAFQLCTPTEGPHGFVTVSPSGLDVWLRRFSEEQLDKLLTDPQFESRPSVGAAARA